MRTFPSKPGSAIKQIAINQSTIKQIVERSINCGQMSRQEYLCLASILLAEQKISDEDRNQINRVFDYIQTGRLKLVE